MARPFQQDDDPEDKQQNKKSSLEDKSGKIENNSTPGDSMKTTEIEQRNMTESSTKGAASCVTNIYCISNSSNVNCGPSFISLIDKSKKENDHPIKIKIRKGVLTSNRCISSEDIQLVAGDIKDDWKVLLKKLPGVTRNDLHFHQAIVNAMDRRDGRSMADIVLCIWRSQFPEFSTVGNLARILFSIGHPDAVTYLKP